MSVTTAQVREAYIGKPAHWLDEKVGAEFDQWLVDEVARQAQPVIDEHMRKIAGRVMDVFGEADDGTFADDIMPKVLEALGLLDAYGVNPERSGTCEHGTLLTYVCADCPQPMNAREKVQAIREGRTPNDGYGKPLTKNARGEWVNEIGDTPCPACGEMTNRRCWRCGWVRPVPLRVIPFGDHPADGILIADDEQAARDRTYDTGVHDAYLDGGDD